MGFHDSISDSGILNFRSSGVSSVVVLCRPRRSIEEKIANFDLENARVAIRSRMKETS